MFSHRTAILGLSLLLVGCHGYRAAVRLDRVATSLDRYGFASVSTPFLAGPSDAFDFDLDKPAEYYLERALKSQGGGRAVSREALDAQTSVKADIELGLAALAQMESARSLAEFRTAKARAAAQKSTLEALVASSPDIGGQPVVQSMIALLGAAASQEEPDVSDLLPERPTGEAAALPTGPPIPPDQGWARAAVGDFLDLPDAPSGPFQISTRQALLIANGDKTTESLFRWFMRPTGGKMSDYELFLCPVFVSVQPGWETRRGFAADLTVNVDLARPDGAGGLTFCSSQFAHSSPPIQVAGVFPVVDSQVLDLVSARQRMYALAFQMALTGFGAQAESILDYARSDQFDAQSATPLPVASAYTAGPTSFGFRVVPAFTAVRGLQGKGGFLKPDAGGELTPRSFPALAALLVHQSYLYARDEGRSGDATWDKQINSSSNAYKAVTKIADLGRGGAGADAKYPYLVFRISVRWTPLEHGLLSLDRYTEVDAWERARAMDKVESSLPSGPGHRNVTDHLASRAIALKQMALDSQALVRVWHSRPEQKMTVADISPSFVCADRPTVLTVTGKGFKANVGGASVSGMPCEAIVLGDQTMLVVVPAFHSKPVSGVGTISNTHDHSPLVAQSNTTHRDDPWAERPLTLSVASRRDSVAPLSSAPELRVVRCATNEQKDKHAKVNIEYDEKTGRITQVHVEDAFENTMKLVEALREALAAHGDADVQVRTSKAASAETTTTIKTKAP